MAKQVEPLYNEHHALGNEVWLLHRELDGLTEEVVFLLYMWVITFACGINSWVLWRIPYTNELLCTDVLNPRLSRSRTHARPNYVHLLVPPTNINLI